MKHKLRIVRIILFSLLSIGCTPMTNLTYQDLVNSLDLFQQIIAGSDHFRIDYTTNASIHENNTTTTGAITYSTIIDIDGITSTTWKNCCLPRD